MDYQTGFLSPEETVDGFLIIDGTDHHAGSVKMTAEHALILTGTDDHDQRGVAIRVSYRDAKELRAYLDYLLED
jgi:hypothetical protein